MPNRRAFLAGALAAGLAPKPSWADAGNPSYLSAAQNPDGSYALFGITHQAEITFEIALPARGHAAAAHPKRPEAVAFARRPGTYALVIDCRDGTSTAVLAAPKDRHFYGHGAFSSDGELLFTTENDFEHAAGMIGVWDARKGYERVGEFSSGGVGPHDIKLMPDGQTLAVANGGIETHPEAGRAKLNIPTMRPNLSLVSVNGAIEEQVELEAALRKNSIRHLAVGPDGAVAFAMQWQGDTTDAVPLLGLRRTNGETVLFEQGATRPIDLQGYVGSVAMDRLGRKIAITSPRAGVMQVFDAVSREVTTSSFLPDVCGVAPTTSDFAITSGEGLVAIGVGTIRESRAILDLRWDNHLVAIASRST